MEFFNDFIAVSVDLTLLGFCVREYVHSRRAFQVLKTAPQYKIDGQLKSIVERQPGKKIPYAVIRGSVSPISTLPDHKITNGMIYELRNQEHGVEIGNTIGAVVLNVDLVYDDFNHSSSSVFDHVCGFFSGVRQRRLQTAEEVLREGSFLTAFGELKLDGDTLRLQSSQKGPLLITTASKRTLFKRLENVNKGNLLKLLVCSAISIVLIAFILRKIHRRRKVQIEEVIIHNRLELERRQNRSLNLSQDMLCVVCCANRKEIIILPCGHVCLCEECSQKITVSCPVCRGTITSKAAAFIV